MRNKNYFYFLFLLFLIPLFSFAQERCRESSYGMFSYRDLRDCSAVIASCGAIGNTTYVHDHSVMPSIVTCRSADGTIKPTSGTPVTTSPPIPKPSPTPVNNEFIPLVGIPGVDPDADFGSYINALYVLSISLAALLAVIKIIVAGVKWMLTDVVTSKADAKKDIQGALLGLLIIISAVVILTVINPNLVEFKILPDAAVTTP